jgi:hypothetical protein
MLCFLLGANYEHGFVVADYKTAMEMFMSGIELASARKSDG